MPAESTRWDDATYVSTTYFHVCSKDLICLDYERVISYKKSRYINWTPYDE